MSNILNIKNLDGDWDSIVAIRGKQGEPGADGTQFEVNARFVPGNNVVPIADFITDKGTPKEVTHTIYAPKGEGGGTTVEYTDLHTFTDTMTVGEIGIDGESTEVVIPANVSEFANDAGYITRSALPTKVSELTNDAGYVTEEAIPTKVSEFENDMYFVTYASAKLMIDGAKTDMAARSGQLIAMEWDAETEYSAGDYVLYTQSVMGGAAYPALYKALSDNTNVLPTNRTVWRNTLVADELGSGGGSNISVGHAYKRGSYSVASNAYDDITLSVTLPEGAIPISVVPYVEGSYTEIWAKEQYTYENNVLTQKVWTHNKGSSTATCHPCINVWYLMGASQYDAGATQGEER